MNKCSLLEKVHALVLSAKDYNISGDYDVTLVGVEELIDVENELIEHGYEVPEGRPEFVLRRVTRP